MNATSTIVHSKSLGDWILESGATGIVVVLLTLFAVYLAVRCARKLQMERLAPIGLQRSLESAIHEGDLTRAATDAAASGSMLGKLASAGVRMSDLGLDEMLANVERAATRESIQLGNQVSNLSRLGGAILLFGFFGSAMGFMRVLQVTSATPGAPSYTELAHGFLVALSSVSLGLFAAIGCFGAFFLLDSKVTKVTVRVSEIADELQYLAAEKQARAPSE